MSSNAGITANNSSFSFFAERMRMLITKHPEWWAWFFSLLAWVLIAGNLFTNAHETGHLSLITYCTPHGIVKVLGHSPFELHAVWKEEPVYSRILTTISNGLVPWIIMIVAMMFPLLNEPIKHVAFSVKRKDRNLGIGGFLTGYLITWTAVGVALLLLSFLLNLIAGNLSHFTSYLITASGFLLAAVLIWHPGRPIKMTKCGQTAPIRIQRWHLFSDSLFYGMKMGINCLHTCWVPMAALVLAHHNIPLMCIVTAVIIYDRYLLPHTSRVTGYAWVTVAAALLIIGIL
jgi:predicted metal-binding membrane protein